jgi:hypothetical protein
MSVTFTLPDVNETDNVFNAESLRDVDLPASSDEDDFDACQSRLDRDDLADRLWPSLACVAQCQT